MTKRKTNVQAVRDMMEFSNFGVLSQLFIVEAITRYARECAEQDPKQFDTMLISGEAWTGVAKEIIGKLEAQYGH